MKTVVAIFLLGILAFSIRAQENSHCGPIPKNVCITNWKCTSDSGWLATAAAPSGCGCMATTPEGDKPGACRDSSRPPGGVESSSAQCIAGAPVTVSGPKCSAQTTGTGTPSTPSGGGLVALWTFAVLLAAWAVNREWRRRRSNAA